MDLSKKTAVKRYFMVFGLGLLLSFVFFLPFIIWNKGYFIYYGDFNVQQIPFYQLAHDSILSGNTGWNWYTDLGANFVGSYAFYLLGSPYFWLTLLFPSSVVPYLMAPLLMLKFATAAVTSYAYIKRFVGNPNYAVIGGLLYAFSGFSLYNVFFNHFHEVIAFFPLLLIALEEFVINGRRGVFALAVALCAVVNYYFFFGQVVFCILYFVIRLIYDRDNPNGFRVTFKKFLLLALEAVLGLLLSAALLLPGLMAITGNPRTSEFLFGWNGLFYSSVQRYGLILHSFFFPPDIPAYPNFFPDSNAKWSSVSAFLPLFSMTGVLAYFKGCRKSFLKALFGFCGLFAMIPFLNSAFSAFNSAYYARWFYMPVLIMSLMTVSALEKYRDSFSFSIRWTAIITAGFALISVFPSYVEGKLTFGKLPKYQDRLWAYVLIVVIGLILTALLVQLRGKQFFKLTTGAVSFMSVVTAILILSLGAGNTATVHRVVDMGLHGEFTAIEDQNTPETQFYRIDLDDCMDNFPMFWKIPTIQAFQSVVPASIFEFYDAIGYDRNVGSRPGLEYAGLRALTSVQYLLSYESREEDPVIGGFTYCATENGFKIYENENYVPMGFTYDYYITREDLDDYAASHRDRLMVRAIVLSDEAIARNGDILSHLPNDNYPIISTEGLSSDAADRTALTCDTFYRDNKGFTATFSSDTDELVFFSVPYDDGWTATVNGVEAQIEKANVGFMAVRVPAGEDSVIRFTYKTPGLTLGLLISGGSLLVLALYVGVIWFFRRRKKLPPADPYAHLTQNDQLGAIYAEDAYVRSIVGTVRGALKQEPEEEKPPEEE